MNALLQPTSRLRQFVLATTMITISGLAIGCSSPPPSSAACEGQTGCSTSSVGEPAVSTTTPGASVSTLAKIPDGAATVDNAESSLGTVLVDGTGHVLYVYRPDGTGPPTCVDSCATAWPPLVGSAIAVATGIPTKPGQFKLVARPDGTMQLSVNGHPLYRFSGDTKPGDTNGEGLANQWYVAGPDGNPING
ncbi:MAG: hypothetical protein WCK41_12675 [Actinomycetes bacterium]